PPHATHRAFWQTPPAPQDPNSKSEGSTSPGTPSKSPASNPPMGDPARRTPGEKGDDKDERTDLSRGGQHGPDGANKQKGSTTMPTSQPHGNDGMRSTPSDASKSTNTPNAPAHPGNPTK
ncbi:MAG TPA: hypothetical protein PLV92_17805, partial [Pirellulaceae bacterium]|nr:hypothetical protein [Pirellulaceae bacterium]